MNITRSKFNIGDKVYYINNDTVDWFIITNIKLQLGKYNYSGTETNGFWTDECLYTEKIEAYKKLKEKLENKLSIINSVINNI